MSLVWQRDATLHSNWIGVMDACRDNFDVKISYEFRHHTNTSPKTMLLLYSDVYITFTITRVM